MPTNADRWRHRINESVITELSYQPIFVLKMRNCEQSKILDFLAKDSIITTGPTTQTSTTEQTIRVKEKSPLPQQLAQTKVMSDSRAEHQHQACLWVIFLSCLMIAFFVFVPQVPKMSQSKQSIKVLLLTAPDFF